MCLCVCMQMCMYLHVCLESEGFNKQSSSRIVNSLESDDGLVPKAGCCSSPNQVIEATSSVPILGRKLRNADFALKE